MLQYQQTNIVKAVFFCVTEIIIVQFVLKHIWKKANYFCKTATYFARRFVRKMESRNKRYGLYSQIYQKKNRALQYFATAPEHTWMCLIFGDHRY